MKILQVLPELDQGGVERGTVEIAAALAAAGIPSAVASAGGRLVKELQSLALDISVLDKDGNKIQLSTLCNEDDVVPYSNKAALAAFEEENVETDDIKDSFLIEDADGTLLEDEEDDDSFYGTEVDFSEDFDDEI